MTGRSENQPPATDPSVRFKITVPDGAEPERLDQFALENVPEIASRKAAYKLIKRGRIHVDGTPARPNQPVRPGQTIALQPDPTPPPPLRIPIKVPFQDSDLAVVEKPPGIPVSGNYPRTLQRALPVNLAPSQADDALPYPRPVHRLDAPTGGLLLVAKTASAMVALGRQFETRHVQKRYRALLVGRLQGDGDVSAPIDDRQAKTHYHVLTASRSLSVGWVSSVDLWPKTGRTHQLRRHMASIGHPVLGDTLYSDDAKVLRGKGLFLWAVELTFTHPATGESVRIEIPPPRKFASYLEREARRYRDFHGRES